MEGFTKKFDPRHSFLILEPPCDDPSFWETARVEGLGDWLELDLDDFVRTHVENFITKHDNTVWQILRQTATWGKLAQYLGNFCSSHTATYSGWTTSSVQSSH